MYAICADTRDDQALLQYRDTGENQAESRDALVLSGLCHLRFGTGDGGAALNSAQ